MEYGIIKLLVKCKMLTCEENSKTHAIKSEARPNLFINDMFFPSRVIIGQAILYPGDSGDIAVDVIVDKSSMGFFCANNFFCLYDGPRNMLAQCKILNVISDVEGK